MGDGNREDCSLERADSVLHSAPRTARHSEKAQHSHLLYRHLHIAADDPLNGDLDVLHIKRPVTYRVLSYMAVEPDSTNCDTKSGRILRLSTFCSDMHAMRIAAVA